MKKVCAALALLACFGIAQAQQGASGGSGAPSAPQAGGKPHKQEDFNQVKANIVAHIQHRIEESQKHLACVQAAQNPEQLKACRPPRREGHGGHDGGPHGGPQSGPKMMDK